MTAIFSNGKIVKEGGDFMTEINKDKRSSGAYPDEYHPIWEDATGEIKPNFENGGLPIGWAEGNRHPDPGVAAEGHSSHEIDARPLREIFGYMTHGMSARERRSLVERHLTLAKAYDGPGGS